MDNELQTTDVRLLKLQHIQEQFQSSGKGRLYIWGAAANARLSTSFITKNSSLSVEAYVVNDMYFKEETFLGRPVLKASDFYKTVTENDWVIITNLKADIVRQTQTEIPPFIKFAQLPVPFTTNADMSWLDLDFYRQHKERFKSTRDILADEISRQTFDAFIKGCTIGDTEDLDRLCTEGQYFNDLTGSCKAGCFVDCGAYTGDTIESAFDFFGDRIERVIAFEPDPEKMAELKERLEKIGVTADKLKLLQKGSYDESALLRFSAFSGSSGGSTVSETGEVTIEADSIDNASKDMGEISFVKMDVEGSELKSILGAEETIRQHHPILAVCVYHKPQDLFELPEAIRKITNDSGYKYYLRYHGPGLLELVLYAVPVK